MVVPSNSVKRIVLIVTQDGRRIVDVQGTTVARPLPQKP